MTSLATLIALAKEQRFTRAGARPTARATERATLLAFSFPSLSLQTAKIGCQRLSKIE
jgi:hypothetical protein